MNDLVVNEIATTIVTKIYEILKQKIIELELEFGQRIDIRKLSEQFGTSQTPIRAVLNRLSEDGLITYKPRKGYYVTHLTRKDMEEIYELRKVVECYALEKGFKNIDRNRIRKLLEVETILQRETNDSSKIKAHKSVDKELHLLIAKSFDNKRMYDIYLKLYPFVEISQQLDLSLKRSIDEHVSLMNAIMRGDLEKALCVLDMHISNCRHEGLETFGRARKR